MNYNKNFILTLLDILIKKYNLMKNQDENLTYKLKSLENNYNELIENYNTIAPFINEIPLSKKKFSFDYLFEEKLETQNNIFSTFINKLKELKSEIKKKEKEIDYLSNEIKKIKDSFIQILNNIEKDDNQSLINNIKNNIKDNKFKDNNNLLNDLINSIKTSKPKENIELELEKKIPELVEGGYSKDKYFCKFIIKNYLYKEIIYLDDDSSDHNKFKDSIEDCNKLVENDQYYYCQNGTICDEPNISYIFIKTLKFEGTGIDEPEFILVKELINDSKHKKCVIFDFDCTISSIHVYAFLHHKPRFEEKYGKIEDIIKIGSEKLNMIRKNINQSKQGEDISEESKDFIINKLMGGQERINKLISFFIDLKNKGYDLFISSNGYSISVIKILLISDIKKYFKGVHGRLDKKIHYFK